MATLAPAATVTVELPAPLRDDGLKVSVTPAGWPEAVSAMAEWKPPTAVLVSTK